MLNRQPLMLLLAVVVGLTVGTATASTPSLVMLAFAGGVALVVGAHPLLLVAAVVLFDENLPTSPFFEGSPPVLTIGWQLYEPRVARLSLSFVLLMICTAGVGIRALSATRSTAPTRRPPDPILIALCGLVTVSVTMSLLQESEHVGVRTLPGLALNAVLAALPWLTMLLAYIVGTSIFTRPAQASWVAKLLAVSLIAKGAIGLGVLLVHGGATVDAQKHVIFYDAAFPALAASALLGYLLAPADRRARFWCIVMSVSTVVLSFRRAIWLGLATGFLLLPLARKRSYVVARAIGVIAAVVIIIAALPEGVRSTTFGRVTAAVSVIETGRGESSAVAHADDVKVGLEAARARPITGLGVRAAQLKKLAAMEASSLYVHNEFLQTWLRYGLLGLLGLLLLLGIATYQGWVALSSGRPLTVLTASCAALVITLALPLMTAPFLTTTRRWPIILGMALAILRAHCTAPQPAAPAHELATLEQYAGALR